MTNMSKFNLKSNLKCETQSVRFGTDQSWSQQEFPKQLNTKLVNQKFSNNSCLPIELILRAFKTIRTILKVSIKTSHKRDIE